jgi:symmetrical bis(5'-nucleosyl)-tetraphosphatase
MFDVQISSLVFSAAPLRLPGALERNNFICYTRGNDNHKNHRFKRGILNEKRGLVKPHAPTRFFQQEHLNPMAVYAIGDVQGCLDPLQTLLNRMSFNASRDVLWFTGDLVERGPQSLEVLRFVKDLEDSAVVVLGNHDLHLLAAAAGAARIKPHNTIRPVLTAPDRKELIDWLASRPLLHHDADLGLTLVHAGLLPQWELEDAKRLALEAENAITDSSELFFQNLFGDRPDSWTETLPTPGRWRVIIWRCHGF